MSEDNLRVGNVQSIISGNRLINNGGKENELIGKMWQALRNENKYPVAQYRLTPGKYTKKGCGQCDLYVEGKPPEIYEVKTELTSHSLGSAVAQLWSYKEELRQEAKLFFVLPESEKGKIKEWMRIFLENNSIELIIIE